MEDLSAVWVILADDFAPRRVINVFAEEGVSFIIHAGDQLPFHAEGSELETKQAIVLAELEKIAPVTAIRGLGGTDSLPETALLRIGPATFHIRNKVRNKCGRSTEHSGCGIAGAACKCIESSGRSSHEPCHSPSQVPDGVHPFEQQVPEVGWNGMDIIVEGDNELGNFELLQISEGPSKLASRPRPRAAESITQETHSTAACSAPDQAPRCCGPVQLANAQPELHNAWHLQPLATRAPRLGLASALWT